MNNQPSTPNTSFTQNLGSIIGVVAAFLLVMQAHDLSFPLFKRLFLNQVMWGSYEVWSLVWFGLLFCLIVSAARALFLMILGALRGLFVVIAIKFTLWRNGRR